ncbi:MAG: cytochrome c oxidase assembly protein [Saccharospirillum sp.]
MSEPQAQNPELASKIRKSVTKMVATTVGMLAFVWFGLVPMYDLICEWTGITGRTTSASEEQLFEVQDRDIRVQFLARNGAEMPWDFRPVVSQVTAKPGEIVRVDFYARNPTDQDMIGQAIPSLAPFESTPYFHKTACFCFDQQPLAAGEEVEMAMVFQIDPELPDWIKTINLSYTLYEVPESRQEMAALTN